MTTAEIEDSENTSMFVKRGTRATLAWLTGIIVSVVLALEGWQTLEIINVTTDIEVIKGSRFTLDNGQDLQKEITRLKDDYKDSLALLNTKMEVWDLQFKYIEKTLKEIQDELKEMKR